MVDLTSTIIPGIRLARSILNERESTTEKRSRLFNSLSGISVSFRSELGEEISMEVRNCAWEEEKRAALVVASVHYPERPAELFDIEVDFQYHYMQMYLRRSSECANPLIRMFNFVDIGPEDFKIEFLVSSEDPPTIQSAFERLEAVFTRLSSEYSQYLRELSDKYGEQVEVSKKWVNDRIEYSAELNVEKEELIPQPGVHDFMYQPTGEPVNHFDRIQISHFAHDYIKFVKQAEFSDGDALPLID